MLLFHTYILLRVFKAHIVLVQLELWTLYQQTNSIYHLFMIVHEASVFFQWHKVTAEPQQLL